MKSFAEIESMKGSTQYRVKFFAAISFLAGLLGAAPALADIIPPKNYATTPGGINVADGSLQYSVTDLSLGTLQLVRSHRTGLTTAQSGDPPFGSHFDSNFNIYVSVSAKTSSQNPRNLIVHLGRRASGIYGRYIGSNFVGPANKDAEKGSLSYDGTRYTYVDHVDGGGTVYTFHPTIQAKGVQWASESRVVERIDFPDGNRRSFSYDGSGNLKLVEDSSGYAIVFDYNSDGNVTAACAFNRSQTYVSATSTCAGAQMKTLYDYSNGLNVTDVMGQVTSYTMSSKGMTCLKPPGYSTCTMSVVYSGNRVVSQTLQDGGTWGTSGMAPEVLNDPEAGWDGYNETTMTDPNGVTSFMAFANTSPLTLSDALGYTTTFTFKGSGQYPNTDFSDGTFLTRAAYPGGMRYEAEYLGPYWAISKETMVAKPGSGLADLVKTYGYVPLSGTCTIQNCTKPIWIRDPNNNQTDFTYASHGALLTEMKPAPTAGAPRPLKINTYVQKYAYIKNSGGSLVQGATLIWLRSTETQCQTVAGSSAATCDPGGPRIDKTYQYGTNGVANNLLVRGIAATASGETRRTCFGYDGLGRKISETKPRAGLTVCPDTAPTSAQPFTYSTRYDLMGRVTGTFTPAADGGGTVAHLAVRNTYDAAGRLTKVESGRLLNWASELTQSNAWSGFEVHKSVDTSYNAQNQKTLSIVRGATGAASAATQYSYDNFGRLHCAAVRMNPAVYGSLPGACTLGTEGLFGPDRITKNIYNARGDLTTVQKAVGTSLVQDYATYTYSGSGKQTSVTDARGYKASMGYDGFDRLSSWNFPSPTTPGVVNGSDFELYAYDQNGNRTSLRKRDGSILTYTFDALNRMTIKTVPERAGLDSSYTRDVYYAYDWFGLMTGARFDGPDGPGITNGYNGFGEITLTSSNMPGAGNTITFEFDKNGNRTRVRFDSSNYFRYSYDGLDRATSATSVSSSVETTLATYTYNERGSRGTMGGNFVTSYNYYPDGRLLTLTNTPNNPSYIAQYGFTYNPASQIVHFTRNNDAYAWTGATNINQDYSSNGLNQYIGVGGASYSHDANGNLTSDGSTTYVYDVENRLVGASGTYVATLRYDPLGRLYETSGGVEGLTRFGYDGDALMFEWNSGGTLRRRYAHGPSAGDDPITWFEGSSFAGGELRQLRFDHQGSIVAVANASGTSMHAINTYDEYGRPGSSNLGRFQYTGQAWMPELGLYYYKARMYSPRLGRFMQTDPIGYAAGLNLYAYVGGDPINKLDPSGNEEKEAEDKRTNPGECTGTIIVKKDGSCGTQGQTTRQMAQIMAEQRIKREHPDFHEYSLLTRVCDAATQYGCNAEYVFGEGLSRYPAPGLDGSHVENGAVRDLPVFGRTQFFVDPESKKILNVTLKGHLLYPGYVERQVITIGTSVFITTHGVGTGRFGGMNSAGSPVVWPAVDIQVIRSLMGIYPQKIFEP